jgi:hypothetical protein
MFACIESLNAPFSLENITDQEKQDIYKKMEKEFTESIKHFQEKELPELEKEISIVELQEKMYVRFDSNLP